jgi:hypothetical protein
MDLKSGQTVDIRARQLELAGKLLRPALEQVYVKYGLGITLTILMYYTARGIMYSTRDDSHRAKLVLDSWRSFKTALKVQRESANKALDNDTDNP